MKAAVVLCMWLAMSILETRVHAGGLPGISGTLQAAWSRVCNEAPTSFALQLDHRSPVTLAPRRCVDLPMTAGKHTLTPLPQPKLRFTRSSFGIEMPEEGALLRFFATPQGIECEVLEVVPEHAGRVSPPVSAAVPPTTPPMASPRPAGPPAEMEGPCARIPCRVRVDGLGNTIPYETWLRWTLPWSFVPLRSGAR